MSNIVTIHQIEHAPHISLFKKFAKADIIVLGDTFSFKKNYFENRNKIIANNSQGWQWITVPVESHNHKPMSDIKIAQDNKWQEKYKETIYAMYKSSRGFPFFYHPIKNIINFPYNSLMRLNIAILYWMLGCFNINKPIYFISELNLDPSLKSTDLLVAICKKLNATTYLSGASGKDYLELDKFGDIKVEFHEKEEGLSALDNLFRFGGKLE